MSYQKHMRRVLLVLFGIVFTFLFESTDAYADTACEYLRTQSVGASIVFSTSAYNDAETENLGIEVSEGEDNPFEKSLVMVNATSVLNVRAEADSESELVGKMYRDCGGYVVERGEGWSYIESGDLRGWCVSDYLAFDDEAITIAKDVGTTYATVTSNCATVYTAPDTSSEVLGYASEKTLFEVIYEVDENWLCIAFDEYDGYIEISHVEEQFDIDHGETIEAINERKAREAEEKKKMIRRNEAIAADGDTTKVLATIIWCESRGESYEGQLAVGSVIMNRVRSGVYPNTVYDVVFASGQFSPVRSGAFQKAYENSSAVGTTCWSAAEETLNGYTNIGDMTHFRRKGNRDGYIIGNHVFY